MKTTLSPVADEPTTPLQVEAGEVLSFAESHLPPVPASLLEVGCGAGRLAAALRGRGWQVKGIDPDEGAVAAARDRGVDADAVSLLDFVGGPFDAVLFTRSLHHIWPLDRAAAKVSALMRRGGTLIVDECAQDEVDPATAAWFEDAEALLEEAGVLVAFEERHHGPNRHQHQGPDATPLGRWKHDHAHHPPLHGARAMTDAIAEAFDVIHTERLPYLHRYFAEWLKPGRGAAPIYRRLRDLEAARIAQGLIVPVGLRIVARQA